MPFINFSFSLLKRRVAKHTTTNKDGKMTDTTMADDIMADTTIPDNKEVDIIMADTTIAKSTMPDTTMTDEMAINSTTTKNTSIVTTDMQDTAANRTYSIPELRIMILEHAQIQDLLRFERVNKTAQATIARLCFSRPLWKTPDPRRTPSAPGKIRLNPILTSGRFIANPLKWIVDGDGAPIPGQATEREYDIKNLKIHFGTIDEVAKALENPSGWMKMLVFQDVCREDQRRQLVLSYDAWEYMDGGEFLVEGERTLRTHSVSGATLEKPLTMEEIMKALMERHRDMYYGQSGEQIQNERQRDIDAGWPVRESSIEDKGRKVLGCVLSRHR